ELDGHARRVVRRRRACPGDQGAGMGAGGLADPDRGRRAAPGKAGPVRSLPGRPVARVCQRGHGERAADHDRRRPAIPVLSMRRIEGRRRGLQTSRDVATAPIALWWPASGADVQVPGYWYLAALLILAILPPPRTRP